MDALFRAVRLYDAHDAQFGAIDAVAVKESFTPQRAVILGTMVANSVRAILSQQPIKTDTMKDFQGLRGDDIRNTILNTDLNVAAGKTWAPIIERNKDPISKQDSFFKTLQRNAMLALLHIRDDDLVYILAGNDNKTREVEWSSKLNPGEFEASSSSIKVDEDLKNDLIKEFGKDGKLKSFADLYKSSALQNFAEKTRGKTFYVSGENDVVKIGRDGNRTLPPGTPENFVPLSQIQEGEWEKERAEELLNQITSQKIRSSLYLGSGGQTFQGIGDQITTFSLDSMSRDFDQTQSAQAGVSKLEPYLVRGNKHDSLKLRFEHVETNQVTCCHMSQDGPTDVEADAFMVSVVSGKFVPKFGINTKNKDLGLDVNEKNKYKVPGFEDNDYAVMTKLKQGKEADKVDENIRSFIREHKIENPFDDSENEIFSDHTPITIQVGNTQITTFNASYRLLHVQAHGGMTRGGEDLRIFVHENDPWPSEEVLTYFLDEKVRTPLFRKPFVRFVDEHQDSDVILLQEWVMPGKYRVNGEISGDSDTTNAWAKRAMAGYRFFETKSGLEGSCIAYKLGKAEPIVDANQKDPDFWAWCGVPGRTWSVVKVTPEEGEATHFVCINVHAPSTADTRTKETQTNQFFNNNFFFEYNPFKNKTQNGRNRYNLFPHSVNQEFLELLTRGASPYEEIGEAIQQCGGRVVIGGDWNDQPEKTKLERNKLRKYVTAPMFLGSLLPQPLPPQPLPPPLPPSRENATAVSS